MEEKGGAVSFGGSALSIDDVSEFMSKLKQSKYFSNVELKKTTAVKAPGAGSGSSTSRHRQSSTTPARSRGRAREEGVRRWNSSSNGSPRPHGREIGVLAAIVVLLTALNYFVFAIPTFGASISEVEAHRDGRRRADAARRRLTREAGHRQQPEPVPPREGAPRAAPARGARRAARREEDRRAAPALPGPGPARPAWRSRPSSRRPRCPRGSTPASPSPWRSGHLPRDRHLLRLAGPPAPHRQRQRHLLSTPKDVGGKVVLNAKFLVTTFMFVAPRTPPQADRRGRHQMTPPPTASLGAALLAAACGDQDARAPRAAGSGGARRPPQPPAGSGRPSAAWSYSSVGKRDPFRSFLAESPRQRRHG